MHTAPTHTTAVGDQNPPGTESASKANRLTKSKNAPDWPRKRRSSVNALMVATAPPFSVDVGLITEHSGRFLLITIDNLAGGRLFHLRMLGGEVVQPEPRNRIAA